MNHPPAPTTPDVAIGAYFYPLTTRDSARAWRGEVVGRALGIPGLRAASEIELARNAQSLFEGHQQPNNYCILDGDQVHTQWDDNSGHHIISQMALASAYGLSYFIFDSYTGLQNGKEMIEMREARRIAGLASIIGSLGFRYARMETLESARVALPIPRVKDAKPGLYNNFAEPHRQYDLTPETARFIVADAMTDWSNDHYLKVGGRPYLSVLMPAFAPDTSMADRYDTLAPMVETLYGHAAKHFGWPPYLVGVMRHPDDIALWNSVQVDAVTQYAALVEDGPAVQHYDELADKRTKEWSRYSDRAHPLPFTPSVSVGWDASPRGEQGYTLTEVEGLHPYTPIVIGNTICQGVSCGRRTVRYHVRLERNYRRSSTATAHRLEWRYRYFSSGCGPKGHQA